MLDMRLDRELSEFHVTAKKWLLSVTIQMLFDAPPSLKEAARAMGSFHQNVKQIALKLQEKGLLRIVQDDSDARVSRLVMTEEFAESWNKTITKGGKFTDRLFEGIEACELQSARGLLDKLIGNLERIDENPRPAKA